MVDVEGVATHDGKGGFEVILNGFWTVHSKRGGDGFVDTETKFQAIAKSIQCLLLNEGADLTAAERALQYRQERNEDEFDRISTQPCPPCPTLAPTSESMVVPWLLTKQRREEMSWRQTDSRSMAVGTISRTTRSVAPPCLELNTKSPFSGSHRAISTRDSSYPSVRKESSPCISNYKTYFGGGAMMSKTPGSPFDGFVPSASKMVKMGQPCSEHTTRRLSPSGESPQITSPLGQKNFAPTPSKYDRNSLSSGASNTMGKPLGPGADAKRHTGSYPGVTPAILKSSKFTRQTGYVAIPPPTICSSGTLENFPFEEKHKPYQPCADGMSPSRASILRTATTGYAYPKEPTSQFKEEEGAFTGYKEGSRATILKSGSVPTLVSNGLACVNGEEKIDSFLNKKEINRVSILKGISTSLAFPKGPTSGYQEEEMSEPCQTGILKSKSIPSLKPKYTDPSLKEEGKSVMSPFRSSVRSPEITSPQSMAPMQRGSLSKSQEMIPPSPSMETPCTGLLGPKMRATALSAGFDSAFTPPPCERESANFTMKASSRTGGAMSGGATFFFSGAWNSALPCEEEAVFSPPQSCTYTPPPCGPESTNFTSKASSGAGGIAQGAARAFTGGTLTPALPCENGASVFPPQSSFYPSYLSGSKSTDFAPITSSQESRGADPCLPESPASALPPDKSSFPLPPQSYSFAPIQSMASKKAYPAASFKETGCKGLVSCCDRIEELEKKASEIVLMHQKMSKTLADFERKITEKLTSVLDHTLAENISQLKKLEEKMDRSSIPSVISSTKKEDDKSKNFESDSLFCKTYQKSEPRYAPLDADAKSEAPRRDTCKPLSTEVESATAGQHTKPSTDVQPPTAVQPPPIKGSRHSTEMRTLVSEFVITTEEITERVTQEKVVTPMIRSGSIEPPPMIRSGSIEPPPMIRSGSIEPPPKEPCPVIREPCPTTSSPEEVEDGRCRHRKKIKTCRRRCGTRERKSSKKCDHFDKPPCCKQHRDEERGGRDERTLKEERVTYVEKMPIKQTSQKE